MHIDESSDSVEVDGYSMTRLNANPEIVSSFFCGNISTERCRIITSNYIIDYAKPLASLCIVFV